MVQLMDVLVYAYAQDFTVEGGSLGEMHAKKIWKVQENVLENGCSMRWYQ